MEHELEYVRNESERKRACIEQSRGITTTTTSHYYYQSNPMNGQSCNNNNVLEIKVRIRPWWISRDECMSIFFYVPILSTSSTAAAASVEIQDFRLPAELDDGSTELCSILDSDAASKMCASGDLCSNMTVWPTNTTMESVYRNGCFLYIVQENPENNDENKTVFFVPPGLLQIPYFLRDEIWESASLLYGYMEGEDLFYREMFPSFENVCGGVSLANSSHITSLVSSLETTREIVSGDDDEMGASNILKKSKTAFGICFELFTIYGNITLRRDRNSGGTVSFKGARSVKKIFDILQESLGTPFVKSCLEARNNNRRFVHQQEEPTTTQIQAPPLPVLIGRDKRIRPRASVAITQTQQQHPDYAPSHEMGIIYPGFFGVHMAVVTSCLGKRLSVSQGNSLESHVHRVLGVNGVSAITSLDDDNNSVKIRILDWALLVEKSREILQWWSDSGSTASAEPEREWYILRGGGQVVCSSENTISITGRGSVIVRLSWEKAMPWDMGVEQEIMASCWHLCNVLKGCC